MCHPSIANIVSLRLEHRLAQGCLHCIIVINVNDNIIQQKQKPKIEKMETKNRKQLKNKNKKNVK